MNQVTELLQMTSPDKLDDAVARLTILFDLFRPQPGFIAAEIARSTEQPDCILVIHCWEDITDWLRFQSSDAKINFSSTRPAALYNFLPCGMNWQVEAGAGESMRASFIRRQIVRGGLAPARGDGIGVSRTCSYLDYEPTYQDTTMRITWLENTASLAPLDTGLQVVADERYESVFKFDAPLPQPGAAVTSR